MGRSEPRTPGKRRRRGPLATGLVVALVSLLAVLWHKAVRHQLVPRNFGVVTDGAIFRSGRLTPRMLNRVVREHRIRTIVDLDGCSDEGTAEASRAGTLGVKYRGFCMSGDGRGSAADIAQVVGIMADPSCQPVLVHCAAGAQRTSAAVLAYRHLVEGRDLVEVYPESFAYGHEADEWVLLAFLADTMPAIRDAHRERHGVDDPARAPR